MHCDEVRPALPDLLYGDRSSDLAQAVQAHLTGCPACQAELAGLKQAFAALDKLPVPAVQVDVARIYADSQVRQELRRWRRLAMSCAGAAALVLLAFCVRLELRVDGEQLVLRWGKPAAVAQPLPLPPPVTDNKIPPPEVTRADLELLRELIHALADDVDGRGRQQQQSLASLQKELERLDREAQERWAATVRYVASVACTDTNDRGGVEP